MWGWFGGGAAQKRKDSPKNAILGLRSQLDMLQKREKYLETQIQEQENLARKHVSTNKAAAKAALRRKKAHERSMEQTMGQIGTLEQQIYSIESANINRETLAAMEKAGKAMEEIHGKLTPEKVDETMYVLPHESGLSVLGMELKLTGYARDRDKLRDQNALSEEIVNAIVGNQMDTVDDDELMQELEEMEQENLDQEILKTGNVPTTDAVHNLPAPAQAEPVSSKKQAVEDDEEAELEKLRAEMAM
ncbi:ESCRT-III subunit protein snf7 [Amphichorda felina]